MGKHWNKLNNRQKTSKIERFEYIMNKIEELEDEEVEEGEGQPLVEEDETPVTANISVKVTDDLEDGIGNVGVSLSNDTNEYVGTTGNAGGCTIKNVPVGEYDVNVLLSEQSTYEYGKFTVVDGENNLNIIVPSPNTVGVSAGTMEEEDGEW